MKQLPAVTAIGNIHMGTMTGKLNGVMPAQMPTGWRRDQLSISLPTFSANSPLTRCGMPQANSTTSSPRVSEPMESDSTLPCSAVTRRQISSAFFSISALNRNITRARRTGGVAAQAGRAFAAAAMAVPNSCAEASGTRAVALPLAGSNTSPKRPLVPATRLPAMK